MADLQNIVKVTDKSFETDVLNHDGYVLVDFWADWCPPCKLLEPELEKLAEQYPNIRIAKFNVDENPVLSEQFQILSIPTMMLVTPEKNAEGKRKSMFTMGYRPLPALKDWLGHAGFDTNTQPIAA
jgi:thioredoxin 1